MNILKQATDQKFRGFIFLGWRHFGDIGHDDTLQAVPLSHLKNVHHFRAKCPKKYYD